MPYDSYTAKSARRARCVPPGANFIVRLCDGRPVRLRGAGCTVYFCGWFAPYGIDQQFLGYQLLPRHGRAMAKFLSSWGLTTSDACFKPFTERSCANRRRRICGALAATICGLILGTFAGATHGYAQRCLTIFWIPYWRSLPYCGNYRCSVCRTEFVSRHVCRRLALLPRMVRSIYSMVHDELKKSTLSPPVWMAHQR